MSIQDCTFVSHLFSVAALVVTALAIFIPRSAEGKLPLKGYKTLLLILCLVGALGFLNYAVLLYEIEVGCKNLSEMEAIGGSLVKVGKIFGVDENLDQFIISLKKALFHAGVTNPKAYAMAGICAGIMFVAAPILGGIGLLEIVAGIFPRVQLFGAGFIWYKDKYYFSELNDGSLELARSICRMKLPWKKKLTRPILIFTGVDPESDEADNNRRISEAKALGAICLRADLTNAPKTWLGKKKFLLLSENEAKVLQQLSALGEVKNYRELKNTEVFFSVADDAYEPIDKRIQRKFRSAFEATNLKKKCNKLKTEYEALEKECISQEQLCEEMEKKRKELKPQGEKQVMLCQKPQASCEQSCVEKHQKCLKKKKAWEDKEAVWEKQLPIFTTVRTNFNLVTNLLTEIPLFEPLIDKEKKADGSRDLVVSILGAGGLGMEMFLSTYWMGQMLDCNLIINVYSQAEEKEFKARLNHINPEILETEIENSECLWIDSAGKRSAKPYFKLNYKQCTLGSGDLKQIAQGIEASDYCFVALGSDMENIDMASRLCRCVGEYHITDQEARTVIAYVVYDSKMAAVLNSQQQYQHRQNGKTDVYMRAVGSLEEVYSVRNVFMPDVETEANAVYQAYMALQNKEKRLEQNAKRFKKSEYDCRASIAQAKHKPYKMFSTGLLTSSVFNCSDEEYAKNRKDEMETATKLLNGDPTQGTFTESAYEALLHRISWLEHRRWNAFTRIMGYRSTKLLNDYYGFTGSHKNMPLRLHACLVECDESGIRSGLDHEFYPVDGEEGNLSYLETAERDRLDELTLWIYQKRMKEDGTSDAKDFKFYDYFKHEKPKKEEEEPKGFLKKLWKRMQNLFKGKK